MRVLIIVFLATFILISGVRAQTGDATNVPDGYQPYANGIFYNSSTELYYDPGTGNYSSTFPTEDIDDTTASTSYPGLPNTGGGSSATENAIILVVTALIAIGAGVYVVRRSA